MHRDPPEDPAFNLACPRPFDRPETILLAHGGGGRLSRNLIQEIFLEAFRNPILERLHDGAELELERGRWAFTTDSYVINPLFFPGGDIGSLAVHGTINDLAMCGAQPRYLSAGFILEEGLPFADLEKIASSMGEAARAAGVRIVTGDTKVVDRGKGDRVFINTAGMGWIPPGVQIAPHRVRPGDVILLNGTVADHGISVLSVREGLEFQTTLTSDAASLHELVGRLLEAGGEGIHVLRDPTRGGVATSLNEIAGQAGVGIVLDESRIPLNEAVRGACEILGLDPLYVANEGKCLACVDPAVAGQVLHAMHADPLGRQGAIVGEVTAANPGKVLLRTRLGHERLLDLLSGQQLPRIC